MTTARTYYRLFEIHNAALWPLQWLLLALGLLIAGLAMAGERAPSPVLLPAISETRASPASAGSSPAKPSELASARP